jgi:hypothetical protein
MKNSRFSLWLAATFLAGGVASWLLTVPPAWADKQAEKQTGWRYQCTAKTKGTSASNIQTYLNEQGTFGWELVTVDADGIYCMRRRR